MFKKACKYDWRPYTSGVGGYYFDDPIFSGNDEIIGTVWIKRCPCLLLKHPAKKSSWRSPNGFQSEYVFYAVGNKGIFYDANSMFPVFHSIHRQSLSFGGWRRKINDEIFEVPEDFLD